MTRATSELKILAERLLELEIATGKRAAKLSAAARVSDRLRQVLSTLLGVAGYRALLARAATLAKAEAPALDVVQVMADGSLEGLRVVEHGKHFADAEVVLVAHLLGLLVTFIGEALMLRLVNDAWPKASLGDLRFDQGTRS